MKCIVSTACVLSVLVAVSFAAPYFPAQFSASSNLQIGGGSGGAASTSVSATGGATAGSSTSGGGLTDVLSSIDIPALLRSVNSIVKLVGVFCPPLSQVLDNVIQNVTSVAFRVFGRAILRNGLGGGGGSSGSSGGGSRVNVVLPTYPPDEDDDYDEDEDQSVSPGSDDNVDLRISQSSTTAATVQSDSASPANDDDNTVAKRHVRVIREANAEAEEEDQDGAESAPEPAEDLSNVDEDDADRNKRYSPFGGAVAGHGGGSGNFLFDIIRNTADRAARTVGTVYRMVAGTENLGWGLTTNTATSQTITSYGASAASSAKLVAGSGATEESDERAHGPGGVAELDIAKGVEAGGHAGEGIPGPITRLFVVANRGLANLVQDLILRLAQTSERLVNFKARLVTSLI